MAIKSKKIPQTRDEWISYGKKHQASKKRQVAVVEIPLNKIEQMWKYQYQAKFIKNYLNSNKTELKTVLASNSLANLKKEIKRRGWKIAWLSTSEGSLSYGQTAVEEYPYVPRY